MAALFFQIICYFGKLGKDGLQVFDRGARAPRVLATAPSQS